MAVTLPSELLTQYERFSLYNSPYPAHDRGCAIDLYPGTLRDGRTTVAPSPVAGIVRETRTVRAPPKPYAPEHDHLIVIDCEGPAACAGLTARVLHVDPSVEAGDRVDRGDSLGTLVRAGFFAPWVDNHLHVGFRPPDRNPYRATGSLPIEIGVDVRPIAWDGTGTVVATGDTYAVLDSPTHPVPGDGFGGIQADGGGGLDGGLPHYDGGGLLGGGHAVGADRTDEGSIKTDRNDEAIAAIDRSDGRGEADRSERSDTGETAAEPVSLNGDRLGIRSGRTITWDDVTVMANGEPITGLSLFCARDAGGAKLICPDRSLAIDDRVRVRIETESCP